MTHVFSPALRKQAGGSQNSRLLRATQRNPISKKQIKKKKRHHLCALSTSFISEPLVTFFHVYSKFKVDSVGFLIISQYSAFILYLRTLVIILDPSR